LPDTRQRSIVYRDDPDGERCIDRALGGAKVGVEDRKSEASDGVRIRDPKGDAPGQERN
jgi:hypothetical protein